MTAWILLEKLTMESDAKTNELSLEERKKVIHNYVCFSMLNDGLLTQLANLAFEIKFAAGEKIVTAGELIDSVYIIVHGTAEVTQAGSNNQHIETKLLEKLTSGESIGLSESGFYSKTGLRTATVTALSDIQLLGIGLENFQNLLKENPEMLPAMHESTDELMRINFIKQAEPFAELSYDQLRFLAQQIEDIAFAENTYLFKQGEKPDSCYLIRHGKVVVEMTQADGSNNIVATLEPPALFGEAAILMDAPRNASARTTEKCEMYVLRREKILQLVEQSSSSAKFFMRLMMDRSRPVIIKGISVHHKKSAEGQIITTLRNTQLNKYYQLAPEGWFIWQQINGERTVKDIILIYRDKYKQLIPGVISSLIHSLAQLGFVELQGFSSPKESGQLSFVYKIIPGIGGQLSLFWEWIKMKIFSN